jgi:putative zinc finger protein
MECTGYRESVHDLVDGTIGPIRRAELERHIDGCADCRALVADLEAIRDAAGSLDPLEPPSRVWLQLAGRLRQEGRLAATTARRPTPTRHAALLAIAAALVLAVGASVLVLLPRFRANNAAPAQTAASPSRTQGNAPADATVQDVESEFRLAEQHYQNAITKLEQAARLDQAVNAGQSAGDQATLDPQTAAMLQKNLHVIDAAIAESRAALRSEPQSAPARDSLFDALKRKVALLQDTIALMNEMRKGNAAGAAQIIQGASKS